MKVDIIPVHSTKEHKLGDGLLKKGKGRGPHGMTAILRAWQRCDEAFLLRKVATCSAVIAASWLQEEIDILGY